MVNRCQTVELANGVEGLLEPLEGLSTAAEQMVDRQTGISRDTMMAPFLEGEGTRDDQQPRRQMARTPRDTDPLTESRSEQLAELKTRWPKSESCFRSRSPRGSRGTGTPPTKWRIARDTSPGPSGRRAIRGGSRPPRGMMAAGECPTKSWSAFRNGDCLRNRPPCSWHPSPASSLRGINAYTFASSPRSGGQASRR